MKIINKTIAAVIVCSFSIAAFAQNNPNEKFAIKAGAGIGLGNSISTSSSLTPLSTKSSSANYGVDFGWKFWQRQNHSLELNVGVAYSPSSLKFDLGSLDYDYSAPASADMDGNTYQRYYELKDVEQKVSYNQLSIPVYLSYAYRCNAWLQVHGDLGVRLGFKTGSEISDMSGEAYSYGIYPEYDDLLIDASYLNDFGNTSLADARRGEPACNGFSASVLIGAGAEFKIYRNLSADLSLRYNAGISDLFKKQCTGSEFTNETAPVSYSVTTGQQVKSLTDYSNSSKTNLLSLQIGLIYRF